jgi:peptidoglycan/xylan/chitin deacetylase (PgdA/CDA1 family)
VSRVNLKIVALHALKGLGAFWLARRLTRSRPRIVCYHGGSLGDECDFNPKLFCTAELLERRVRWLTANGFVPQTLDEMLAGAPVAAGATPIVMTLDDGWYSTHQCLLPVLAKHHFKPTLYLATKVFQSGLPVVDVCLRYIVWKSGAELINLQGLHATLDGRYDLRDRKQSWAMLSAAIEWVRGLEADRAACYEAYRRFAAAFGLAPELVQLASRRFSYMDSAELLDAAAAGCRIELHGHVHKYERGATEKNAQDIAACRAVIVALGLPEPRHYCYPSGAFDCSAAPMLRAQAVLTATTCVPGLVGKLDDDGVFFLPRFLDGSDVSMIEFEAEMSGLTAWLRRSAKPSNAAALSAATAAQRSVT